jgi:hypothetical protein
MIIYLVSLENYFTLKDRRIFRRPRKHIYAYKWMNRDDEVMIKLRKLYFIMKIMDILGFLLSFISLIILIIDVIIISIKLFRTKYCIE